MRAFAQAVSWRELIKRWLKFCTFWFEIPLITVVFIVGAYRQVDWVTNLDHVGFALATAALVRCFEAARHMFERVGVCEAFREVALTRQDIATARTYRGYLDDLKIKCGLFMFTSVISAVVWVAVALHFVFALDAPKATHPDAVQVNATAPSETPVEQVVEEHGLASDSTPSGLNRNDQTQVKPDGQARSDRGLAVASPSKHSLTSVFVMGTYVMFLLAVALIKTWIISLEDVEFTHAKLAEVCDRRIHTTVPTGQVVAVDVETDSAVPG